MSRADLWLNRHPNEVEALLLRCQRKGYVLRLAETMEVVEGGKPKTQIEIKVLAGKRARESGIELSPGETRQIEELSAKLAHALRNDRLFFQEMIRLFRARMNEVYPLGRGCDLSKSHAYAERAESAADAEKPFEFWVLLLMATRTGYAICEEARNLPLSQANPTAEESPTDTSTKTSPSNQKSSVTKRAKDAAQAARGA